MYTCTYIYLRKLHLLPHVVILCFTYANDDDDLQTSLKIIVVIGVPTEVDDNSGYLRSSSTKIYELYIYIYISVVLKTFNGR